MTLTILLYQRKQYDDLLSILEKTDDNYLIEPSSR